MPVYGAEISDVEGEPTFFRLRDGFNNSIVDHVFVANNPKEKAICTLSVSGCGAECKGSSAHVFSLLTDFACLSHCSEK